VITQQEFLLLDYFSLSRREINWLGLTQLGGLVTVAVGVLAVKTAVLCKVTPTRSHIGLLLTPNAAAGSSGCVYTNPPVIGLLLVASMLFRHHGCRTTERCCCELAWKLAGSSWLLVQREASGQLDGGTNAITRGNGPVGRIG